MKESKAGRKTVHQKPTYLDLHNFEKYISRQSVTRVKIVRQGENEILDFAIYICPGHLFF